MKKTLLLATFVVSSFVLVGCGQKNDMAQVNDMASGAVAQAQKVAVPQADAVVAGADKLAACLTEKGFTMYGTERCPHCKAQKQMFGADWSKVNYVDCDVSAEVCKTAGITGYPTWKSKDGKAYPGSQQFSALSQYAGCTN